VWGELVDAGAPDPNCRLPTWAARVAGVAGAAGGDWLGLAAGEGRWLALFSVGDVADVDTLTTRALALAFCGMPRETLRGGIPARVLT
jgi:hypothetical protein